MKLFCKEEMRRLEEEAVRSGISLQQLMEGAGKALAEEAESRLQPLAGRRAVLLCGKGNNGGDGFVGAGLLAQKGAICAVLLVEGEPQTALAREAFRKMPDSVEIFCTERQRDQSEAVLAQAELIVDCVYGFGFKGSLSGDPARFLGLANRQDCFRLAADLPSGTECDTARADPGAFRADVTVAFTAKKPAHCSYPAKEHCGQTVVRQVGVPLRLAEAAKVSVQENSPELFESFLREPAVQSNKGDLGKLLMVCGSYGMAGACIMGARAALRCGVGLLTLAVDQKIYPILAQAVPEAVFLPLDWEREPALCRERLCAALESATACLVGSGLGSLAEQVCPTVFSRCRVPLTVDADALNFCARCPELLETADTPLILTPHPGEMARLCGDTIPEIQGDRLRVAARKARESGAVVALKGAATVVASPDGRCTLNPTGNPGMAKGGSGDVLAGMTASLTAQGVPAFEAAAAGVYLHGLAGDLCARHFGKRAMLPTDLIGFLPAAFTALQGRTDLL